MEGDIQNGLYFSGDVWVDESVGGAASACTDWLTLREEPGDELSLSSLYNLSIVNTGASERYVWYYTFVFNIQQHMLIISKVPYGQ